MKYVTIILALLITFATQAVADGNWDCDGFNVPCSEIGFSTEICDNDPNGTEKITPLPVVDDQTCPTQCNVMNKIYDNCFVDKMQGMSKVATLSVSRSCERIACNPTFFQKLRYK